MEDCVGGKRDLRGARWKKGHIFYVQSNLGRQRRFIGPSSEWVVFYLVEVQLTCFACSSGIYMHAFTRTLISSDESKEEECRCVRFA